MKTYAVLVAAFLVCFAAAAADGPGYTCSMRVGNSATDETVSKGGTQKSKTAHAAKSVKTKTTKRSMSWPVAVSLRGDNIPTDSIKLKCYFFGTTNGNPELLGEKTLSVELDEKGNYKTEVESPTEKLVQKTIKTSRLKTVGRGAHATKRAVPSGTKSVTTGTRVTGCIIQLVVKGKVEKSYASNSGWAKFAKTDPVSIPDVLKIR
jgi:hypothetical protein